MLDPAHIDLVRHVIVIICGGILIWFFVMLFYFWVCERRKLKLRR